MNKDKIKENFQKEFVCEEKNCCKGKQMDEHYTVDEILLFFSAQYEKLIEEVMPKNKKHQMSCPYPYTVEGICMCGAWDFNSALSIIRTSLQERGIKIK